MTATKVKLHRTSPKRYEMIADEVTKFKMQLEMRDRNPDECWIWSKSTTNGYGYVHRKHEGKNRAIGVHRLAYYMTFGEIPEGYVVDHTCHNDAVAKGECESEGGSCEHRLCFNPAHLRAVPPVENTAAGIHRGRPQKWEGPLCKNGLHEWTEENIMIKTGRGHGRKYENMRFCRPCFQDSEARRNRRAAEKRAAK